MISYTSSHSMWYIRLSVYIILHFFIAVTCTHDEIRTNTSWICRGCTYPYRSVCRISPRVYAFLLLLDFPIVHCHRAASPVPTRQESHVDVIMHVLHGFTEIPHCSLIYTNFSQNHCSREFWNPYLVEYNREAMELERIVTRDLCYSKTVTSTLL